MTPISAPSPVAIGVLKALLQARTGQLIADHRSWRVETVLKPLLRDRGLETLDQLVLLLLGGRDAAIGDQIVEALVNQETSFFREAPVFDAVMAAVEAVEATGRGARIWSAGCSSGQEPLSLAMLFAERQAETGKTMPEIVASDVAENALVRARAGRYSQFEAQRGLPIRRLMRWFDSQDGDWVAAPELIDAITFRRINLVADRLPPGLFDVVLCRNVLFYLSPEMKAVVYDRLAHAVRPGGVLVLGAGETVVGQSRLFAPNNQFRGFYSPISTDVPGLAAA